LKINLLKTSISLTIALLFVLTSFSVVGEEPQTDYTKKVEISKQNNVVNNYLNNNSSGRYLVLSAGIRASSYFVKLPRLLTQRGMFLSGEIWYRSNFALTLVFQRNNSRFKLVDFERGTHRVLIVGIGHSTFTRPHCFSFGRVTAFTKLRPLIL
jgi:hypothetical protein